MSGGVRTRARAAAVSMVRNECDIIELFVRINLRTFDHLYIVDHDSSDATPAILERLQAEGLPLSVRRTRDIQQAQAAILTRVMTEVADTGEYAHVMPLDADEFLDGGPDWRWDRLGDVLQGSRVGLVPWKTFVPVTGDYAGAAAPLHTNFRLRSREPVQYHKVVVPAGIAGRCVLAPGSHAVVGSTPLPAAIEVPLELLHVPVRSVAQIIQKALVGSHTLSIKPDRVPGEGFHWDAMAAAIRARNYRIDDADLLRFALQYGAEQETDDIAVDPSDRRIGRATDAMRYPELARIDPLAGLDAFATKACAEVNAQAAARRRAEARGPLRALFARLGLAT